MRAEDLRPLPIFGGLDDDQLGSLLAAGTEVAIEPGTVFFREGEHADHWWVLVDGTLELVRHIGREDVVVGRMDQPGRWAGGFRAWDEHGVYLATARGVEPGRLLRVPADVLRDLTHAWLPLAGHLIAGLYGTARSIEATARQRGALITLARGGLDRARRSVEAGDEVTCHGQPGVGQLTQGLGRDAQQTTRRDAAGGGEVDPVLVPRPEAARPPARLVHPTDDDVLTTDTAHELKRSVDEHPPVVGVLALAEVGRARLDHDLGAGGEERAELVVAQPAEDRQRSEVVGLHQIVAR